MDVCVPATKRLATKCPRDEMAGDEVSPQRNVSRRSVPATKWLATKCPRDEMVCDETAATKWQRRNGGDEKGCTPTGMYYPSTARWRVAGRGVEYFRRGEFLVIGPVVSRWSEWCGFHPYSTLRVYRIRTIPVPSTQKTNIRVSRQRERVVQQYRESRLISQCIRLRQKIKN